MKHLWRRVVRVTFVCSCGQQFEHKVEAINHCARAAAAAPSLGSGDAAAATSAIGGDLR